MNRTAISVTWVFAVPATPPLPTGLSATPLDNFLHQALGLTIGLAGRNFHARSVLVPPAVEVQSG